MSSASTRNRWNLSRLGTVLLLLSLFAGGLKASEKKTVEVSVSVDPRVELLSIIFRLAGNPEYGKGRVPSYTAAVEKHFRKFKNHAAVLTASELRRRRGVSYDAVMAMAIHLEDAKTLTPLVPLDPWPAALDTRWTKADTERFLDAARRFASESGFESFFASQRELYDTAVSRMETVIEKDAGFDWFETFFGVRPGATFSLVLGMLNGGMCYGPKVVTREGKEDLYCVLGVWETDGEGKPRFTRDMLGTVAHEFCHSFANPLIEQHLESLAPAGRKIFPTVKDAMARQAYANWETMMKESLVRACVVRYVHATRGEKAAREEGNRQVQRSFAWVPALAELLAVYERERKKYRKLDAFMPEIAAFFDEQAERLAAAPQVVAMVPGNGARDVDPGLTEIVVTFDRPMKDGMWAFVGGGPKFPKTTGKPSYDAARRVVTLPVTLEPDHEYEFWLNRGRFRAFQSEEGVMLAPVHVTFRTRKRG